MVKTASDCSSSSNVVEPKYKGVRLRKWGKYVSEIRLPNCRDRIWLGSYDSAEKAARAFDAALFCLRGPGAKFNFPEDPPEIPGRQGLSPTEIQAVAQHYGNNYAGPGNNDQRQMGRTGGEANQFQAGPMNSIDWSFLDVLDTNEGHVSDFTQFHEPSDMYMPPPHFPDSVDDGDNGDEDGNGGNMQSFLWNF
ncbi:Ethylene-responsive transcription factor ERF016 [Striga hermonthica]|uniref:Ethylene-responsive transcription factor ERF016 n=1 Tax=Striga hermonthica TaxID=68872 RepID=A0A9N7R4H8_STRHE|nr:Ethylene-responsive transcription factor ERF016 [Striga hermonthica]